MVDLSGTPAFFPAESPPEKEVTWHAAEMFIPKPAGPFGTGQSIGIWCRDGGTGSLELQCAAQRSTLHTARAADAQRGSPLLCNSQKERGSTSNQKRGS